MKTVFAYIRSRPAALSIASSVSIFVALISMNASAASNWAEVFASFGDTVNALKTLVVLLAYLIGVILFATGLWLVYKDGQESGRGHMKNGIIALIIGSVLLIFPTAVGWTIGSMGEDERPESQMFDDEF